MANAWVDASLARGLQLIPPYTLPFTLGKRVFIHLHTPTTNIDFLYYYVFAVTIHTRD